MGDYAMEGFFVGVVLTFFTICLVPNRHVTQQAVTWAAASCEHNGGIKSVRPHSYFYSSKVFCKNGAEFYYSQSNKE